MRRSVTESFHKTEIRASRSQNNRLHSAQQQQGPAQHLGVKELKLLFFTQKEWETNQYSVFNGKTVHGTAAIIHVERWHLHYYDISLQNTESRLNETDKPIRDQDSVLKFPLQDLWTHLEQLSCLSGVFVFSHHASNVHQKLKTTSFSYCRVSIHSSWAWIGLFWAFNDRFELFFFSWMII